MADIRDKTGVKPLTPSNSTRSTDGGLRLKRFPKNQDKGRKKRRAPEQGHIDDFA
jgi:hypothetical protein